jgi:predicted acyltransferase
MRQSIYNFFLFFIAAVCTILGMSFAVMAAANSLIDLSYRQAISVVVLLYLASIIWNVQFDSGDE